MNGAAAQVYTESEPANINPGDVLTWTNDRYGSFAYLLSIDDGEVQTVDNGSPYTVEDVAGAAWVTLFAMG